MKEGFISEYDQKFVPKNWGFESWVVNNEKYCGKILFLKAGKRLSWHYHKVKEETFFALDNDVFLIYGWDDNMELATKDVLKKGQAFHVPPGLKHRLWATEGDVHVIEFSTTHSDDDSIRLIKGD